MQTMSPSPLSPQTDQPLPTWHFPFGPSTKYHTREKSTSHHRRNHSTYTPTAPNLSTERRAHRRAQSHKGNIPTLPSPPASDFSRSPLSRFASFPTSLRHHSPSKAPMSANNGALPVTPAKHHRRSFSLQNASPFSDYYTDEALSDNTDLPENDTQQLLVRMHKLQSQLIRDHASEREQNSKAIAIVGSKLSEIEQELSLLHTQTRSSIDAEDPLGVRGSDAMRDGGGDQNDHGPYLHDDTTDLQSEPVTIEQFRAERDWFILRMQELLSGLNTARSELSKRFAEVRELNEQHNADLEERETQIEQLRSENENLRSEAGFEYSELLFLKLQMKALEVDVDTMSDVLDASENAVTKERFEKKNRILSEMDRWRSDWQDVHGRFQRRRSKQSSQAVDRRDSASQRPYGESEDSVEWHLETVKECRGKVTSLTIRRMDSSLGDISADRSYEERLADSTLGESLYGIAVKTTPLDPHTDLDASTAELIASTVDAHSSQETANNEHATSNLIPLDQHSISTHQGPGEPRIVNSYTHQGTQTEHGVDGNGEGYDDELFPHEDGELSEDDCAITTSSEASDDEQDAQFDSDGGGDDTEVDERKMTMTTTTTPSTSTSAWQELWTSLASYSGMGEERFED